MCKTRYNVFKTVRIKALSKVWYDVILPAVDLKLDDVCFYQCQIYSADLYVLSHLSFSLQALI